MGVEWEWSGWVGDEERCAGGNAHSTGERRCRRLQRPCFNVSDALEHLLSIHPPPPSLLAFSQ